MYKAYVLPALLYAGFETWSLPQHLLARVGAVYNQFLRRILGVRWDPDGAIPISNADLDKITGAWTLIAPRPPPP